MPTTFSPNEAILARPPVRERCVCSAEPQAAPSSARDREE